MALLKVRSTTSRGARASSGIAVGPPKSWYASSSTTSASVSTSSRSAAPSGSGVPVGLLGELTTTTGARVSRPARITAVQSNSKAGARGRQHGVLHAVRGVEWALVLVELARRRGGRERVRLLRADFRLDAGQRGRDRRGVPEGGPGGGLGGRHACHGKRNLAAAAQD